MIHNANIVKSWVWCGKLEGTHDDKDERANQKVPPVQSHFAETCKIVDDKTVFNPGRGKNGVKKTSNVGGRYKAGKSHFNVAEKLRKVSSMSFCEDE